MAVIDKAGLMAIIQPLTGLGVYSVIWEHDPRVMVNDTDRALVTMRLKSSDYLGGADDKRRTYDPGLSPPATATYILELTGPRTTILELKCEVYDKNVEAYEILERVRTLFNGELELAAIGMCYQTCNLVTDLPTTYDNRVVSVALLEIQLGVVSSFVKSEQIGQGWVDTVDNKNGPVGSSNVVGTITT